MLALLPKVINVGTAPKGDKESSCYSLFLVRCDADDSGWLILILIDNKLHLKFDNELL